MSTARRIKDERPDASEELLAIAREVDQKKVLAGLATTEGGRVLREATTRDVLRLVHKLAYDSTNIEHVELVRLCASLRASLSMLQLLNGAEKNAKQAEQDLRDALA
jgi:hypothetical protein